MRLKSKGVGAAGLFVDKERFEDGALSVASSPYFMNTRIIRNLLLD
jgi:hypothetical protein